MATLFAKAAGGNWSSANTWSNTSSAGVDNSGPPSASTDVVLNSGSGQITIDAASVCRSLDCNGYTNTLTRNAFTLTLGDSTAGAGNIAFRFSSGMTFTNTGGATGGFAFASSSTTTQTVTTNAKTICAVSFTGTSGTAGSWQFADAFTSSGVITHLGGKLDGNGFNVTATQFTNSAASVVNALILGSGTWTVNGTGNVWNGANANATLNSTGSTIVVSNSSSTNKILASNNLGWNILTVSGDKVSTSDSNNINTLNINTAGLTNGFRIGNGTTLTINTNVTTNGSAGNLAKLTSTISSSAATISKSSGSVVLDYLSLQDMTASGGATWYAGKDSTSVSGNSGWLFVSPVTSVGSADGIATASGTEQSKNATVGIASTTATASGTSQSIASTVGSADGLATASGVETSKNATVGIASTTATASGTGKSIASTVGSADGLATASGVETSKASSVGTASTTATATGTSQSIATTVGSADGIATAAGVETSKNSTVGTASTTATATGTSQSIASTVGSADGIATASGTEQSKASSVGIATASSTASGTSQALFQSVGTATASSTASGASQSIANSVGSADGLATASGAADSIASSVGTASTTATASGTGKSIANSIGSADGIATASGVGYSKFSATGSADGIATASGATEASDDATGSADGTSTASGTSQSINSSVGIADGLATASGAADSIALSTGTATASSTASGTGQSLSNSVGSADGIATASGAGYSKFSATGSADGVSTASGVSLQGVSTGTANGIATAAAVGKSIAITTGTANGLATATAEGDSISDQVYGDCDCGPAIFKVITTGGIVVGGSALCHANQEQVSGGALCGGCAIVETNKAWDGYAAVYHLHEQGIGTTGEYKDATGLLGGTAGIDSRTRAIEAPVRVAGPYIYSQEFYGVEWISCPKNQFRDTSDLTVSLWARTTAEFLSRSYFSRGMTLSTTPLQTWSIDIGHDTDKLPYVSSQTLDDEGNMITKAITGSNALNSDCWYHFAVVWKSGDSLTLFLNGSQVATESATETRLVANTLGNFIGRRDQSKYTQGDISEVRIYPGARSADWIYTEFINGCNHSVYTVGLVETPILS